MVRTIRWISPTMQAESSHRGEWPLCRLMMPRRCNPGARKRTYVFSGTTPNVSAVALNGMFPHRNLRIRRRYRHLHLHHRKVELSIWPKVTS